MYLQDSFLENMGEESCFFNLAGERPDVDLTLKVFLCIIIDNDVFICTYKVNIIYRRYN